MAQLLLPAAEMVVDIGSTGPTWLSYIGFRQLKRRTCRLFATVALGTLVQTSTGCTLAGYTIGTAAQSAPRSIPPQNARAIPAGTEVEVFYLPRPNPSAPLGGAASLQAPHAPRETEFRIATGAYVGIEADELLLAHPVWRPPVDHPETYAESVPAPTETARVMVPFEQVSLIRTKPSSTPVVVGTVVGAVLDVAAVVLYVRAVRNME